MNSIDHLLNLEIETLLPSHLEPVRGADDIRAGMIKIREAVDFVHSATVAGMNAGKSLSELMVEVRLPERLLLSETHGKVSWAVKSIWEYYATWFHFDRTASFMRRHNPRFWVISPGLLMRMPRCRWSVKNFGAANPSKPCYFSSYLRGLIQILSSWRFSRNSASRFLANSASARQSQVTITSSTGWIAKSKKQAVRCRSL